MCGGERLINTFVEAQSLLMQSARVDGKVGTSMDSPRGKSTSGDSSIDPSNASSHSDTGDTLSPSCFQTEGIGGEQI